MQQTTLYESKRKSITIKCNIAIAIAVVSLVSVFWVGLFSIPVLIADLVFYLADIYPGIKEYRKYCKNIVVKSALEDVFEELEYDFSGGIPEEKIKELEMMCLGNRYYTNDLIKGSYRGVHFEQADVKIQNVTSNGKHTSTTTYFEGRWIILDFNKNFRSDLMIRESDFSYAKKTGGFFSDKEKMQKINFEDIQFNKMFSVYAVDPHEAFYIVTPRFMQMITEVNESIKGSMLFCFCQNKLHIGLNNGKDAFEIPLFKPLDVSEITAKTQADAKIVTDFIDELSLNEVIYKEN